MINSSKVKRISKIEKKQCYDIQVTGDNTFMVDGSVVHNCLYQEQMLQICTDLAGLSKEEADTIRRLTSKKKDAHLLEPFKNKFIEGASKKVSRTQANQLWKDIETTAKYQFNKCLTGDTVLNVRLDGEERQLTINELIDAQDLHDEIFILGPQKISGNVVSGLQWNEYIGFTKTTQDIIRIYIDENTYIDSSPHHRHRLSKTWKEAYRIHQGDVIWTIDGKKKVWKRENRKAQDVYDICLMNEPHAFYANGILTHNSHSVAYAKLASVTAYLKCYYPAEFMASLLNNEREIGSVADYLAECNRLGIEVKTPDVNKSDAGYQVKGGIIYMGLSNIKYISDKLSERLIMARPFSSYEDLKEKVLKKGSGLSSRVLDSLKKVGAANFPDYPLDLEECKNNYFEYLGIPYFDAGLITPIMRNRITDLIDFDESEPAMTIAIVKDIVKKNGWIRVDILDTTGSQGFFVGEDHGLTKGESYILCIADKKIVGKVSLREFDHDDPIVKYLRGEYIDGSIIIAAKRRTTKSGNEMANMVLTYKKRLLSVTVFSDKMGRVQHPRGTKVKLKVTNTPKWGTVLEDMIIDE